MVKWEIFNGTSEEWGLRLSKLPYLSLYQSYEWGEVKKEDGWGVVRLATENKDSQAQIFYKRLPLNGVFLWCPGGILGRRKKIDIETLKKNLSFTYYYFRVSFHDKSVSMEDLFQLNYSKPLYCLNSNQCMVLDLKPTEEELLNNMSSNWRHNLKRFDKKNITVSLWEKPDAEMIYAYYEKFEKMKGLGQQHSLNSIKGVIAKFKEKLVVFRALNEEGELLALRAYIFNGEQALDWYAISSEAGRKLYASNGVLWKLLQHAKKEGITNYDLSGVDPINNAGVYNFKKGTGAKLVEYPGEVEIATISLLNYPINILLKKKLNL